MRSEAWDARLHCESSRGASGQSTTAEKVPSPEEAPSANALGDDDGSVAHGRGRAGYYFKKIGTIDTRCVGKKYRRSPVRKSERRQGKCLLCRWDSGRNLDALI